MKNAGCIHDSLYSPNGGHVPKEGGSCGILLKKRYSSVVLCPDEGSEDQWGPGTMYPRCICLEHNGVKNGTLLATMEYYRGDKPVFPIYESTDEARSWHYLSSVEDTKQGWGCRFQPHLFELPCDMGKLKEGTILCAGNMIPRDMGMTALQMYMSVDAGKTWEFVSEIVRGEKNDKCRMGIMPVWEPFLLQSPKGELFCYYSDERYKERGNYNQLLAHKVSKDGGYTWGEEKIDVAFADGILRPGMPVVAYLPDGKFIMVYEMVNQDRIPVYFRISDSMDDWGDPDFTGNPVVAADGSYLTGTPYVSWIDRGGAKGTILVTGRGFSHIFANSEMGEGFWEKMESLIPIDNNYSYTGYSQCIVPIHGGGRILNLSPCQISNKQALIAAAVADVYERSVR